MAQTLLPVDLDTVRYFTLIPPALTLLARSAKSYVVDVDGVGMLDWVAERGLEASVALALLSAVAFLVWVVRAVISLFAGAARPSSEPGRKEEKQKQNGGKAEAAEPTTQPTRTSNSTLPTFLTLVSVPAVTVALLLSRDGDTDLDFALLLSRHELFRLLLGGLEILFVLGAVVFSIVAFGHAASHLAGALGPSTDPNDGPLPTEEEYMEWGEGASADY